MMEKYDKFREYNAGDIKKLRLLALSQPMFKKIEEEKSPFHVSFDMVLKCINENLLKVASDRIKRDKERIIQSVDLVYDKTKLEGEILGEPISVIRSKDDTEDKEKAVMMALLKFAGFDYGDVRAVMENVKWKPALNETYYFINDFFKVRKMWSGGGSMTNNFYNAGNCFKTQEEAEKKLEKIKEILRK